MNLHIKTVVKQDFFDYIDEHWNNDLDAKFIEGYKEEYELLGKGIGLYDDDKLIGFLFYKDNIEKPYWFELEQRKFYDELATNNIWENNLLEIHPDYRFKGYGCFLVRKLYSMMPEGSIVVTMSEHTDEHIRFYLKNNFIQCRYMSHPKYYLFYRCK